MNLVWNINFQFSTVFIKWKVRALLYYLINDVTVLSVDLCDSSKIPKDTERLIELKPWQR